MFSFWWASLGCYASKWSNPISQTVLMLWLEAVSGLQLATPEVTAVLCNRPSVQCMHGRAEVDGKSGSCTVEKRKRSEVLWAGRTTGSVLGWMRIIHILNLNFFHVTSNTSLPDFLTGYRSTLKQ
jgi:hypothetical protein